VPGFADTFDAMEQQILKDFSSSQFKKRFIHRKGTPGYSTDTTRTLASYGWSSSNYLSKMRYTPKLQTIVDAMRKTHNYPELTDHLQKTLDYVKNPSKEFQAIKSFTFMYYMGANVKSAMVNLSQIPVTLYPYLANQFGDTAAVAAIGKAGKNVIGKPNGELGKILEWADKEGITMDSYLSELIGAASGKRAAQARLASNTIEMATMMFSKMEHYNRRVSVASAWDLVKDKSLEHINGILVKAGYHQQANKQDAIKEFVKMSVTKTQFDYGKYNRPGAFRGWGSVPLQFHQFMVNYLQFLAGNGGGKGAALRSLGVMVAFAGLMGLPGVDDLISTVEYLYTKIDGKHLDIKQEMRKGIVDMSKEYLGNQNAKLFAETALYGGFSSTPFDISGSVGAGRVIPGLSEFMTTAKDEGELEGLNAAMTQMAGASAGIAKKALTGVEEWQKSGDKSRAAEKIAPVAAQNIIKAVRMATEGVDRNYAGKVSISYKPEKLDIMAQALSFNPSERARLYRQRNAEYREGKFLETAHQKMLVRLAASTAEKDQAGIADAKDMIKSWNSEVPEKWKLSAEKVRRSMKARAKNFDINMDTGKGSRIKQLQKSFEDNRAYLP
jgi:hypothetical protein